MYHDFNTNEETIAFIEKYLSEEKYSFYTRDAETIEYNWKQINEDLYRPNVNENDIARYIQKYFSYKNYYKFRDTLYWFIVSQKVKLIAEFKCMFNHKHDNSNLNAHHGDYEFLHGREVQKINLLICLCKNCHEAFHAWDKSLVPLPARDEVITEIKPVIVEKEQIIYTEKKIELLPEFESSMIIQKYIAFQLSVYEDMITNKNYRLNL